MPRVKARDNMSARSCASGGASTWALTSKWPLGVSCGATKQLAAICMGGFIRLDSAALLSGREGRETEKRRPALWHQRWRVPGLPAIDVTFCAACYRFLSVSARFQSGAVDVERIHCGPGTPAIKLDEPTHLIRSTNSSGGCRLPTGYLGNSGRGFIRRFRSMIQVSSNYIDDSCKYSRGSRADPRLGTGRD